jgi:hypothetical protein
LAGLDDPFAGLGGISKPAPMAAQRWGGWVGACLQLHRRSLCMRACCCCSGHGPAPNGTHSTGDTDGMRSCTSIC